MKTGHRPCAPDTTAALSSSRHQRSSAPHGATPTTHIFKLPLGRVGGSRRVDLTDSAQNEWVCAQIVAELGLPVAPTTMVTFGEETVLVVERFDRAWMDDGAWIARLPLEDLCQALGVSPKQKYEHDGGPGMAKCLRLPAGSADPRQDTLAFALTQLTFWLMAVVEKRLPKDFHGRSWDAISKGMTAQAERFLAGVAGL